MKIEDIRIPGKLSKRESELRRSFLEQVEIIPGGDKIKTCLQCGTCSGSCPLSYAMDIMPRELIALFRAGDIETILKSRTIWICASCYSCQTRCPSSIKVTDIIYALKRTAMESNLYSKKFPVHSLSNSFTKSIYRFGRLNEPRLMLLYFLKTGFWKAFSFIPLGIKMMRKNRLELKAVRIKQITGLRKIMKKAEKLDIPLYRKEEPPYMPEAVGYKSIS